MSEQSILVTKASGKSDYYAPEKLKRSLRKSGAGNPVIENILQQIESKLNPGIPTKIIYKTAYDLLKKSIPGAAGRYNLKKAIMELGPSGFPFEQYIGSIFKWQGYKVKVKLFLKGNCVTHEIDVLAENEQQVLMIECKYHTKQGIFSDVKVPLYIQSRFQDVLPGLTGKMPAKKILGSVVTNTKFSADALRYGNCAGLKMLSWNYPGGNSLSKLVDESRLYPITCLTQLTLKEKEYILQAGIVLCTDLEKNIALLDRASVSPARIQNIIAEIKAICT